jgi:hypothetical protein
MTATACPDWCSNDHDTEPADCHAGRIVLSINTELIVTDTPAGLGIDIIGEPGAFEGSVSLGPGAITHLTGVLARLGTSQP